MKKDELFSHYGKIPDRLTKEEKAEIKSALLENLKRNGYLDSYLERLYLLSIYPEEAQRKEKAPVVVTVQINA